MQLSIREAKEEDHDEACELFAEGDTLHSEALPHVFRKPAGPARPREYTAGIIADENAALIVADGNGQLITDEARPYHRYRAIRGLSRL
ncbi:MAG: hypothetical protein WBB22_03465 [Anaerolineae bacterium]